MNVIKLIGAVLAPMIVSGLFLTLIRKTGFGKIKDISRQAVIGVAFGVLTCLAFFVRIGVNGYEITVASAAPLVAGFVFGAPAGAAAGIIGCAFRLFGSLFGFDERAKIAGAVIVLLAGFVAGLIRVFLADNKRPPLMYCLSTAVFTEVAHMLFILLTNLKNIKNAFFVVKNIVLAILFANMIAVMLAVALCYFVFEEKKKKTEKEKKLYSVSQLFTVYLLIVFAISYVLTSSVSFLTRTGLNNHDLVTSLSSASKNVISTIDMTGVEYSAFNSHISQDGFVFVLDNETGELLSCPDGELSPEEAKELYEYLDMTATRQVLVFEDSEGVEYYYWIEETEDYYVIACFPVEEEEFYNEITGYMNAFILFSVFFILFCVVVYLLQRVVVKNIHKVNASLGKITEGDLSTKVDIRNNIEFDSLSDDINMTVDRLKELISKAEKHAEMEMDVAKRIQLSVLPSVFPPYPDRHEFDIYASMNAAKTVGGDFYDFYMLGRHKMVFLIADVSGKGIPAAMFMMNAKSIIKNLVESRIGVAEAFTKTNEKLCVSNDAEMFVTAWMGLIDLETGIVKYVNAGHNPPLIRRKDGKFEYFKARPGFVLAGMEGLKFKEGEMKLEAGDEIFLYTDGVPESINTQKKFFGEERLLEVLNTKIFDTAEDVCKAVKTAVSDFAGEEPPFDDITVLSFKYYGEPDAESITCPAKIDYMDDIKDFVRRKLAKAECNPKAVKQIIMSVDEIFCNIANYAYKDGDGDVTVRLYTDGENARLVFEDGGIPFNPVSWNREDVENQTERRKVGGLGIFMVKTTMDSLSYEYSNGKNILTIVKNLK